jgi:serine/threonine protein kinase
MPFRLEAGTEPIPGYKLIERLGGGGFGEVWKAEAPGGLHKAIKFVYGDLQTASPDGQRAEQELKALSRVKTVRHPYILSLERYDIIDGQLLIVMELADRNLWDRFKECRTQGLQGIPRAELLSYLEESAEALDLMNGQYQLQHLDIKPQNIFLVYNHIKVADFGLVKDLQGMTATVTGGVTPVYAAPETFDGVVSRYCDQYSLAIVFQELLTGQRPFAGTNVHQLIMQHVQGKPNLSSLPAEDQGTIGRALSKSPDERFPTCGDMVRALRAKGEGEAGQAVPAPSRPFPRKETSGAFPIPRTFTAPPRPEAQATPVSPPLQTPPPTAAFRPSVDKKEPQPDGPPPVEAVAEVTGSGELFPALVIGLGLTGLGVLQQLRKEIRENFASPTSLPNLRLLYVDTDPDGPQLATRPGEGSVLAASEVLLAKLNRAIHYQKPREGRPRIDNWFNPNMLYRIPRNLSTDGLRALGRLAFLDNYRNIAPRIKADLEACLDPEALTQAAQQTGLQLRTNRPRVYIVASLAGGTGSGMFIDLAYVARAILKRLGYSQPEVVGILHLPALEPNSPQKKALGNAVAALTELNHFSCADVTYSARFDEREGTITDSDPPFSRCFFLAPSPAGEEEASGDLVGLASEFLFRDLTTPLGRTADDTRAKVAPPSQAPTGLLCQTMGLFRLAWPKRPLLRRAARRYCQHLVQRWMSKDSSPVKDQIKTWIDDHWTKKELDATFMMERLQLACEKALGNKAPENAFAAVMEPFTPKGKKPPVIDPNEFNQAVGKIYKMVGHPTPSQVGYTPGVLEETLRKEAEGLFGDWEEKARQLTMRLIEQPQFRLAGAEEAIRLVIDKIDQILEHNQPLSKERTEQTAQGHERQELLITNLPEIIQGGKRTVQLLNEIVELAKQYPKLRYQSLILRQVNSTFNNLRNFLGDKMRDVGFCRTRVAELLKGFEDPASDDAPGKEAPSGVYLFPSGCRNLGETIERLYPTITETDLGDLDRKMQEMIKQQFSSLHHVCITAASNLLKSLESAMILVAETFVSSRLGPANVVDMFLERNREEEKALDALIQAYKQASPKLVPGDAASLSQICLLAVPAGSQETRFRDLAHRAIPNTELIPAASADDVIFYREETQFPLAKLDHLGPEAQKVYRQMSTENLTPHSRTDIDWLEPVLE